MKYKGLLATLCLLFLISACTTPAAESTPAAIPSSSPTAAVTSSTTGEPTSGPATSAGNPTIIPTTHFTASPAAICQVVQAVPTASAEVTSLIESDTVVSRSMGPKDARFVIDVFSDFQCPACANFSPSIYKLTTNDPKDLRVVFTIYPFLQYTTRRSWLHRVPRQLRSRVTSGRCMTFFSLDSRSGRT